VLRVLCEFQRRSANEEVGCSFVLDDWRNNPTERLLDAIVVVERAVASQYRMTFGEAFSAANAGHAEDELSDSLRNDISIGLDWPSSSDQAALRLSYVIGCVFGRWDIHEYFRLIRWLNKFTAMMMRRPRYEVFACLGISRR